MGGKLTTARRSGGQNAERRLEARGDEFTMRPQVRIVAYFSPAKFSCPVSGVELIELDGGGQEGNLEGDRECKLKVMEAHAWGMPGIYAWDKGKCKC